MLLIKKLLALLVIALLSACMNIPTGPNVLILPGSNVTFEQFRFDEYTCKQYAYEQVGGTTPKQAAISSGVESAAIGAALGAIAGVAIGGGGRGAAIGAGAGLLGGGLIGTSHSRASGYIGQQRYDNSYIQCMYAKGHSVPVSGRFSTNFMRNTNSGQGVNVSKPVPRFSPPPPPPGNPPLYPPNR